ncbi:MAG TPA: Sbal_3080 family lipoprotein [Telluria sp.]|nr:Sbal_3080 family lipoprotein [Telluria sp.]
MNAKFLLAAVAVTGLSGCAIQQTVQPVAQFEGKTVCIVENPKVKPGFLDAYKRTLSAKGYTVRQLAPGASMAECPVTSTYTANWKWDLAMYMAYADITVYNKGAPAGKATYDSRSGGGNMNKFIDADAKVAELVNQLFPGGAG